MNQDLLLRNNTGVKSKVNLIEGFVVRTNQFELLKENLLKTSEPSNVIIIGQRGAGKTTLIHRLNYEIIDDAVLRKKYIPIMFSEEQYSLSDLTNLWETIATTIEDSFYEESLSDTIANIIDKQKNYEQKSYDFLREFLIEKNKTAILFIENFNFFLKKISDNEKKKLFRILESDSNFKVIGTSTTFNDGNIDFQEDEYNFLKIIELDSLNKADCEKLLIKIGQQYGEEQQIRNIIEQHPGRVEALRRLTGGVPRTMSYLFQIFMDNENGRAIKDLYLLIDTLTLLYKSELDQLSTQQQKVVDAIARKWDAISVKEIAKKTRLESKNISSILSYLEKNQFIEKIPTSTKNNLYRIKERFMNIWYLMRFGRKNDKDNVVWLVRFFDAWCDESELTKRVKKHISNLKGGNYDINAAIDMGNTFLSCENLPETLKEELIKTTNAILPDRLLKNTKISESGLLDKIKNLIKENKFEEAESLLEEIKIKDANYYTVATSLYIFSKQIKKAMESAKEAWALDNQNAQMAITIGTFYEFQAENLREAAKYYKLSLELPNSHGYAAYRLGDIALELEDDFDEAIKFHKKAISMKFKLSLNSLGDIYAEKGDYEKAVQYYNEAIAAKTGAPYTRLARLYTMTGKPKDAEKVLLQAIKTNEEHSKINLGRFYYLKSRPNYKKAEIELRSAINDGDDDGYVELARMFLKMGQTEKAIKALEEGVERGNADAAHQLGHVLATEKQYDRSDFMFEKANEMGELDSLGCWAETIFDEFRNDKKQYALELIQKALDTDLEPSPKLTLLHAKILLWNGKVTESLEVIKEPIQILIDNMDTRRGEILYNKVFADFVTYFLLLIVKKENTILLDLFKEIEDLEMIFKPIYFVLMENLQDDFPNEYLRAGKELKETIYELKEELKILKENLE
ncbi:tetratricopeptide repeat protein [Epilithonimonas hominis]|uniref:Tetratricopeptide repeat protein n=1 Tax=Epilithonimonas hominis TaxID=420404 RepID=A0A3N0XD27_9FLAO|nr:tetratricopeptide repeat protein [Epilithonimonas hominis]ROI14259.1 tetratricopeptide repeat protein [Epilithonimonas hominis]